MARRLYRWLPWLVASTAGLLPGVDATGTFAQPIRDVTPQGVTKIYREDNPRNFREPGEKLEPVRVQDGATLATPKGPIRLYGVKLPAPREICRTESGARWACGARAIGALRNLIDTRPIECEPPRNTNDAPIRICWVGGTNLSLWLLEQGWANLTTVEIEKEYRDALSSAKRKRVGLWAERQAP
jgi:endonuclease YncB( thermonuclease family)